MRRQRNVAQMKKQIKTPEKQINQKETANLSDAESTTLVIRMLTEVTEYEYKIKEELNAIQSEIKIFREPKEKGCKLGFK